VDILLFLEASLPCTKIFFRILGDEIALAVQVGTLGWVGFGIAETTSGSMPGADIFTAWVDGKGVAHIQDRHALIKDTPQLDECSDWELIAGEEDSVNEITTIEVTRLASSHAIVALIIKYFQEARHWRLSRQANLQSYFSTISSRCSNYHQNCCCFWP
jgi:hypothetical protein